MSTFIALVSSTSARRNGRHVSAPISAAKGRGTRFLSLLLGALSAWSA